MNPKDHDGFGEVDFGPMINEYLARNPRTIKGPRAIPFLEGHPVRDTVINDGDITNLLIALNTANTLEEFLMVV